MLPFTHAQFIEVFARYNAAVWPAQLAAYLLALGMALALSLRWKHRGRFVAAGLVLMWGWTGIVYHGLHFSAINPAAFLFAALFLVQALLLVRAAFAGTLQFGDAGKAATWLGGSLVFYATVAYPLLGLGAGNAWTELPMFGITPCPVTIFTFGMLLLAAPPVSRWLLVIPVIWSMVGGSAAFLLHVPQDWVLLFSGLSVIPLLRGGPRAGRLRATHPG